VSGEIKPSTKEDILTSREVERSLNEILKPFNIKHIDLKIRDLLCNEKNISSLMIELVKIFGSILVSLKLPGLDAGISLNSFQDYLCQ
jgi:hypothetical protein